jgi:hypothetical protein
MGKKIMMNLAAQAFQQGCATKQGYAQVYNGYL